MSDEQKRILESSLWAIANLLRGKMNPDDYRDGMIKRHRLHFLSFKLKKSIPKLERLKKYKLLT